MTGKMNMIRCCCQNVELDDRYNFSYHGWKYCGRRSSAPELITKTDYHQYRPYNGYTAAISSDCCVIRTEPPANIIMHLHTETL
jgi:hypothetical protein